MQVTCNPLAFFNNNQLGDPLIGIFKLAFQLLSFVAVVGIERQQNNSQYAEHDKRQLRNIQFTVFKKAEYHSSNRRANMEAIDDEKADFITQIADEKRHKNSEINITEQQNHRDIDSHFYTYPDIDKAGFRIE